MIEKKTLRKQVLQQLDKLSNNQHKDLSANIADHLFRNIYWKEAGTIGITISRRREVCTTYIIEAAWALNKQIAVPRINKEKNVMCFYILKDYDDLEETFFELKEPKIENCQLLTPDEIDVMVVPGVAFDVHGYRLGFGGGYYDRYLVDFKGETVALAFDCQIVNKVPTEKHDVPVGHLITPEGIVR
ncbi:5-formyltetrahydrofolate cyclo-ligase [Bacillus solitudinis]|uniref:5-formyltetrahydrofolate cyclo-ligase n=1 Tax=Bacillus solitudinis TaxID=2014074 RepID=UPI000C23713A|nr:5-formyltetrahydrofolate cyclo-ligase [Bacillus solitudinis]